MPASDAQPLGSAKLFWRASLTCGALILAMCVLNASIDPTGQIGLVKTHALNRTVTAPVVSFVRNSHSVAAYERAIATTSADTFLIGTSREARGFDLCDRPNMLRIAGSSWGIREIAQVHAKILETRTAPTTLLIELGVPSDSGGAGESPDPSAAYTALSPRTTWLSFQTVAANMRSDEIAVHEAACRPLPSGPVNWRAAAERFEFGSRLFDTSKASRQRGRAILEQMVGDANRICAKTKIRHTIVYFSLPGTPNLPLSQQFDASLKDAQRDMVRMFQDLSGRHGACRFRYLDLLTTPPGSSAEQQLWRDRDQWSDFTHFSPHLGRLALNAILRSTDNER